MFCLSPGRAQNIKFTYAGHRFRPAGPWVRVRAAESEGHCGPFRCEWAGLPAAGRVAVKEPGLLLRLRAPGLPVPVTVRLSRPAEPEGAGRRAAPVLRQQ